MCKDEGLPYKQCRYGPARISGLGIREGGDRRGEAPRLSLVDLKCWLVWSISTQVCKDGESKIGIDFREEGDRPDKAPGLPPVGRFKAVDRYTSEDGV